MATSLTYNFDELNDRFSTPAAKFKKEYLLELFDTDDLYPFWIADQDFKTSPDIISSLEERARNGIFGYECKSQDFKSIVKAWYSNQYDCKVKPEWMQFTPTIMSSMAMAVDLFTSPKDQVIIQPPVYKEFKNVLHKTDRNIVTNCLQLKGNRYEMNFSELDEISKPKDVTAIMVCNPHNPGGRFWTHSELQKLVDLALKNNLLVISDEIHADVVFSGKKFTSLLSFPEIQNQLVVCYSPAKIFNIASISDSLCIIPNKELRYEFDKLRNRYTMGRTNAFSQVAWTTGFTKGSKWIKELNLYLETNVNYINQFIQDNLPEITCIAQDGTYLVWLDMSKLSIQGDELIKFLAKNAQVGLTNGRAFGVEGESFVRMNISCPLSIIQQSMASIKQALALLK